MADSEDVPAPACLLAPLRIPHKSMMGAGPSNAPPRIMHAGSLPMLGIMSPETFQVMDDIKAGLQYAFQTTNPVTLCLSCAGHGGMEASLANLLEPGDTAVVTKNGFWFERVSDMVARQGARVVPLEAPVGQPVTLQDAERLVAQHRPRLLFLVHGETSTAVLQPLEGFGAMCRRHGALLVVDTVASLGGAPLHTDRLQLDVVYTGSQKVLNAPPGLSPITFSPRAMERVRSRKTPCSVYFYDVMLLGEYWGCFDKPRSYHHTVPKTLLYALREALAILAEEGLTASWRRHRLAALRLHDGLQRLGLRLLVEDPRHRLPTVTAVLVADGAALTRTTMIRHGTEITGGLGPTTGKAIRVGLMGVNANPAAVDRVLAILEDAVKNPLPSSRL